VILMDVVMPVMDGLEAMRRIRRLPVLEGVKIIAISASVGKEDQQGTIEAGANFFMFKPVQHDKLLKNMAELLGLTLIYDATSEQLTELSPEKEEVELIRPPAEEMKTLRHLALEGNMRDIRRQADAMEALDARYKGFADRLRLMAKTYQSKAILEMVNAHAGQGEPP
jgi:CheY-like chemotaxis protein